MESKLAGLVAATYTPMHRDGRLRLEQIPTMVDRLVASGISGLYVCGSTGEGMSLTTSERQVVAEAFIDATKKRVPVIVQVGHNCVEDAKTLTAHAARAGADIVSATCPSYFKAPDIPTLLGCMGEIAGAAPETPFYYYHIPALTGSTIDIVDFITRGKKAIPTLVGLKYTDTKLFEFQTCQSACNGQLDIVFGCDEMLLGALATGATAAIGSTYNVLAPLYNHLIAAFERGDLATARADQAKSIEFIRTLYAYPFHSAMKELLTMQGIECGTCRLPQRSLTEQEIAALRKDLQRIGFFQPQD